MAWFLGQSLVFLALAFLLGLLVGWLAWGRRAEESASIGPRPATLGTFFPQPRTTQPAAGQTSAGQGQAGRASVGQPSAGQVGAGQAQPVPAGSSGRPGPAAPETVHQAVRRPQRSPARDVSALHEAVPSGKLEAGPMPPPMPVPAPDPVSAPKPAPEARVATAPVVPSPADLTAEDDPVVDSNPIADPVDDPVTDDETIAEAEFEPADPVSHEQTALIPEPIVDAEVVADTTPESDSAPADHEADDEPADQLQRIEGIGPKISSVLMAGGVRTYRELADLDRLRLTEILSAGGVKFAPSLATWGEQARLLAAGDEAGFASLATRLIENRRNH